VDAHNIVEDLADGEEKRRAEEVDHWLSLSQNSNDENGFQDEECEEEDQGCELIEDVEPNVFVLAGPAGFKVPCPAIAGI